LSSALDEPELFREPQKEFWLFKMIARLVISHRKIVALLFAESCALSGCIAKIFRCCRSTTSCPAEFVDGSLIGGCDKIVSKKANDHVRS
jgi:hypothetical protein